MELTDSYGTYCILGFNGNSDDAWQLGGPFFRTFYTVFDDANSQVTIAPKKDGVVTDIPAAQPPDTTTLPQPGSRNITVTYNTGISGPYIGLYTMVGIIGAEAITIGVLFGTGIITL